MLHSVFFLYSQIFLFSIHIIQTYFRKQLRSFDICSFIHAIITTFSCHYVFWKYPSKLLNIFDIRDIPEHSNVSWILTYIPIFSMAYSVYDLFCGINEKRWDFTLHGIVMLFSIFFAYTQDKSHICILPLLTETSTIFLTFRPLKIMTMNVCFAITFFLYRILLLPGISFYMLGKVCLNSTIATVLSIGQGTLNSLNGMWGYKIYRIIQNCFKYDPIVRPILLLEYINTHNK